MTSIVSNSLTVIFAILGLISIIWTLASLPLAIIFGIRYSQEKNSKRKETFKKWMIIGILGIFSLPVLAFLFFLTKIISKTFGF